MWERVKEAVGHLQSVAFQSCHSRSLREIAMIPSFLQHCTTGACRLGGRGGGGGRHSMAYVVFFSAMSR